MTDRIPDERDGWIILSARLIERRLKEAGLSQVEFARRLHRLGATQAYPTISAKLARGSFPAGFLIQAFAATGASTIALPTRSGSRGDDAVEAADDARNVQGDQHTVPATIYAEARGAAVPTDDAGWQSLAVHMVESTLTRSGGTRADLFWRLRRMNIHLGAKELGQKLRRGNYQAYFMLQVLVALGCERIELPALPPQSES